MFGSLKTRLIVLLVLATLPTIGVIYYHADTERAQAVESSKRKAAEVAEQLARTQRQIIIKTENFLKYLATIPEIQDPSDPKCGLFLNKILKLNTRYINIGVPRADGELLCNAFPLTKRVNVFDRAYFQYGLTKQTFSIGTFQHDRAAKKTSVNFAYPVLSSQNRVVGLVVAVVSLEWWNDQLQDATLPEGTVAYISDYQGNIVANYPPDIKEHGSKLAGFNILNTAKSIGQQKTEIISSPDGQTRVFTHIQLYKRQHNGQRVMLSVGIPFDDHINTANQRFFITLLTFIFCVLLLTLIAYHSLESGIIAPLERLTAATDALEHGIQTHLPKTKAAKELLVLQKRFEHMAGTRLEAENAAKHRTEELNSVFNALPDIYFRISDDGSILDYKATTDTDFLICEGNLLGKKLLSVLPTEIAHVFQKELQNHIASKKHSTWEFNIRTTTADRTYEARASAIKGTDDAVIVIRNITDQKKAEASIHLAAMVYNNCSEGMVIVGPDGEIIDTNQSFNQLTGYSREELLGQNINILRSGRHEQAFYKDLWKSLTETGKWEGEIYNMRKNGEIFPSWLTIDTIYGDDFLPFRHVGLYRDITEKKKADELIWQHAHFDALTGLPNRVMLLDRIDQEQKKAKRNNTSLALLFLDLDRFKEVNDTLGHDVGDQLLQEAAQRLQSCVRDSDTIARQGGDEFIIILSDLKRDEHTAFQIERTLTTILNQIAEPFLLQEQQIYITASIGIAFYPDDAIRTEDLLKAADQAMYKAKSLGKNRFNYFTHSMQDAALNRMHLISDLRKAIRNKQFTLLFQPIISLKTGKIQKAEALIRWHHPSRGSISPREFIALAEETYLIHSVGAWVFEEAIEACPQLLQRFGKNFQLSINISPVQFASADKNLVNWLPQLEQAQLSPSSFIAEITENVMMDASQRTIEELRLFEKSGMQVALDDFGTGYSCLAYISQYNIDYLKIDRSFVQNITNNPESIALCEAIMAMAHKLGIKVIAEGIETKEQFNILQKIKCDFGQGFLFGHPMPLAELLKSRDRLDPV